MLIPKMNMNIGLFVFIIALTTIDAQRRCLERSENCVDVHNCPEIITILRGSRLLSSQTMQMLRDSQCGFEDNETKVCCNQETSTTSTTSAPEEDVEDPSDVTNHPNLRLLNDAMCGPIIAPKVFGGTTTGVLQYPWMALIMYDTGKPNPEFRCGGTVISSRYILTAAHCVTSLQEGVRLIGARVGDHDISTERDCERDDKGLETICIERYQDFGMDTFHFHPEYMRTKLQNDIALIRLNGTVDFRPVMGVKPICLPIGTAALLNQKNAVVTGWGATEFGPRSTNLQQAPLPLISNADCREAYRSTAQIWHKQICAGGQMNVDSCFGDSGGPLQAHAIYNTTTLRMVQYGVVSYGHKYCGTAGFPGVYTRVAYYVDWILDTMRE